MGIDYDTITAFGWQVNREAMKKWVSSSKNLGSCYCFQYNNDYCGGRGVYNCDPDCDGWSYEQDGLCWEFMAASPEYGCSDTERYWVFGVKLSGQVSFNDLKKLMDTVNQKWYSELMFIVEQLGAEGEPSLLTYLHIT